MVLLLQSGICEAGGPSAVLIASMFALSSNVLRLSRGVSKYAAASGWITPANSLVPRFKLEPTYVCKPRVVFVAL
jgi:hypothetical protein